VLAFQLLGTTLCNLDTTKQEKKKPNDSCAMITYTTLCLPITTPVPNSTIA